MNRRAETPIEIRKKNGRHALTSQRVPLWQRALRR